MGALNPLFVIVLGFGLIILAISFDLYLHLYRKMGISLIKKILHFNYFSLLNYFFYFSVIIFFVLLFISICSKFLNLEFFPLNFTFWFFFGLITSFAIIYGLFNLIVIFNSEKFYSESLKNPNRRIDEQKIHHAIIISSSTTSNKKIGLFVGTDLLIQYFIRNLIPFQTYLSSHEQARALIQDERTKFLYLFGHGYHGGLAFYQTNGQILLEYDSFNNLPEKKFIAQLHCNRGDEKSLCEKCNISVKERKCFILKGIVLGINLAPDIWLNVKFNLLNIIRDFKE